MLGTTTAARHTQNTKQMAALLKVLVSLACWACSVTACIFQYGARHEVPHYSYGYVGLDWPHEYPTCTGALQSPIHIPGHTSFQAVVPGEHSIFDYGLLASNGSNVKVVNNGHTVQVVFPAEYVHNASVVAKGDPATTKLIAKFANSSGDSVPATRVKLSPAQFHSTHTASTSSMMHIVNFVYNSTLPGCGADGCATVIGVLFELYEEDAAVKNKFIDTVFNAMSSFENVSAQTVVWLDTRGHLLLPTGAQLNFNDVLPADRSYVTYSGSLTTPPCTEGILWHLLTTPVKITRDQLHQFEMAVGDTDCAVDRATIESATRTSPAKPSLLESGSAVATASAAGAAGSAAEVQKTTHFEVPAYIKGEPAGDSVC
ncbi:alpha carbonic anhydrase [Scenedesmus sp. NREL 46B-D3]|nr:alpha carbonic anhydrase [Scenedesmus sp. NREL 46B-D3]